MYMDIYIWCRSLQCELVLVLQQKQCLAIITRLRRELEMMVITYNP